jgi:two-component system sensor histidine kinase NreB
VLEVRDDGRGITEHELNGRASLGLVGMRERAKILGGSVEIRPAAGKGTVAMLSIPLSNPASSAK